MKNAYLRALTISVMIAFAPLALASAQTDISVSDHSWIKGQQDALTAMKEDLQGHPAAAPVLPQQQLDLINRLQGDIAARTNTMGEKDTFPAIYFVSLGIPREGLLPMLKDARGAVLQRSQSGNTIVASDLAAALDAVRHHPKDGVVWQTGDEPPSAHLLKVSGGIVTEAASEHKLIRDQEETTRQTEKDMLNKAVKAEKEKSETQERIVVPVEDAVRITPGMLEVDDRNEPTIPAGKVLIQVASSDSVSHDEIGRHIRAEKEPLASKVASERAGVSRIVNELANTERDIIRQPENSERGRMPEREEQTLTRTIQKER